MLAIEEILRELAGEETNEQGLPPGFRFHPTDEELITFYLASKVFNGSFCGIEIAEVDLNRCEPWELPDVAKMGEREWYFFSLRDRKYPTGLRTNRATSAGYWKATGKDREVYSAATGALLGMKKTLVFYKGRAPRGEKTKWVMHEYRLDGEFSCRHTCKEEWVICRIFNKSGEKKNVVSVSQGQSYVLEMSSSSSSHLPSLLEITSQTPLMESGGGAQTPMHQPPQFLQENEFKSLIMNPVVPPLPLPLPLPPHNTSSSSSSSLMFPINGSSFSKPSAAAASMLFKSLLSHQDCTFKEEPKQCKTEINSSTSFSHFQIGPAGGADSWMDKIHPNPLFFEMETAAVPFKGNGGFPCSSIKVSAESWPLDS